MSSRNNPHDEVMEVINKYSKELKKEGVTQRWYGLNYDKGKINQISLGYSIDKNLKYEEAQNYFFRIVDGLLKSVNGDEKIRGYFYRFPMTYEDLHFALAFDYENKGHLKKDDVSQISIKFKELFFFISNIDGATNKLVVNDTYRGIGTISFSGEGNFRTIKMQLPEIDTSEK